jgi:hypothetical protein
VQQLGDLQRRVDVAGGWVGQDHGVRPRSHAVRPTAKACDGDVPCEWL